MEFAKVKAITVPEGKVVKITANNMTLWQAPPTFINQLPISTDLDGSIYNGIGYKANTGFTEADGSVVAGSKVTTGFIPLENYGGSTAAIGEVMIYMQGVNIVIVGVDFQIAYYDINKKFNGMHWGANLSLEQNGLNPIYTLNENGYINSLDISAITAYYHKRNREAKYFRICCNGIDEKSIITVNEPIE